MRYVVNEWEDEQHECIRNHSDCIRLKRAPQAGYDINIYRRHYRCRAAVRQKVSKALSLCDGACDPSDFVSKSPVVTILGYLFLIDRRYYDDPEDESYHYDV